MEDEIYKVRSSKITEIGRFKIHMDQLEKNGKTGPYSYVSMRGGVHVIPVIDNEKICIIKQYRYPIKKWDLEFPGGAIDEGDIPEDAARRELIEETGYVADKIIPLGDIYPSPGYSDEHVYLFAAFCSEKKERRLEPLETIEELLLPFDEVDRLVKSGEITFGGAIIAWNRLRQKKDIYETLL